MLRLTPDPAPLDLLGLYDAPGPLVRGGMVSSADGAAAFAGSSRPLSPAPDREALRVLRAVADVVLVGAGTARAEDYGPVPVRADRREWRRAHGRPETPALALVSRRLALDPAGRWASGRPVLLTCAAAPADRRTALAEVADLVVAGEQEVDLRTALSALRERGLQHVLCEGGPALLGALAGAGLLEELCLTVAPMLAGAGPGLLRAPLPAPVPLELLHVLEQDGCLLLRYRVGAARADQEPGPSGPIRQ